MPGHPRQRYVVLILSSIRVMLVAEPLETEKREEELLKCTPRFGCTLVRFLVPSLVLGLESLGLFGLLSLALLRFSIPHFYIILCNFTIKNRSTIILYKSSFVRSVYKSWLVSLLEIVETKNTIVPT